MSELSATVYDSVEAVNRNQWNNVVEQSDLGSVFHRYEWVLAVERGTSQTPKHVVVDKKGNPVAILPSFTTGIDVPAYSTLRERLPDRLAGVLETLPVESVEDLPFKQLISAATGFGGPVITTDEEECLRLLFEALSESSDRSVLSHTIKAKELGYMRYGKVFAREGYEPVLLDCRFELDLNTEFQTLVDNMDKERRKAVRQARSSDYEIVEHDLGAAVESTHRRHRTDIDRVDGDVCPRPFLEELAAVCPERTKLIGVEVDGVEAGRYLYVLDDEQSTVHYYLSAVGDESHFQYNPTELLHSHAIEWGQEQGYDYYDFGSTGSTFVDGLFKYKEKYGGRVIPTLRWEKGHVPVLWPAYKIGRRTYQKFAYGTQ